jgi:shikimate kinase
VAPEKPCRIVLIGMMGSGKSTIGRLLSARLGWPYLDNDILFARAHGGESARLALATGGVEQLRGGEAMALRQGLAEPAPCIVGAAAGTILDEDARRELAAKAIVVWLDASPATLARRARGAAHRPWLDSDAESWMRRTLAQRAPLYKSVADLIVNTQRRRPASVVNQVIDWLGEQPGCMRLVEASTEA